MENLTVDDRPLIGMTMGDPAGIGPELCLKACSDPRTRRICRPRVYGCSQVLAKIAELLGLPLPDQIVESGSCLGVVPGEVSEATGRASFSAVDSAIAHARAGEIDAVVTAPIHKEAWAEAGIPFPGHTELLADRCDSERFCMMMTSPTITCALVTTHIGLCDVPSALSTERILEVIELSHRAMQRINAHEAASGRPPRLAVLGLNPHAGEGGLFGNREEESVIQPAIELARVKGLDVVGPFPPDTAFLPANLDGFDAHICMYHDQGLIPFKTLAFDTGVNTTLGLDMVRTSVDHGTALDLAWQGTADVSSMMAAIQLAVRLARPESL